jgi:hypothetical protein
MAEIEFNQDAEATQAPTLAVLNFTAGKPIYALTNNADPMQIKNQLDARLAQLSAMLVIAQDCLDEGSDRWSDSVLTNYIWGCSMVADECKELAALL